MGLPPYLGVSDQIVIGRCAVSIPITAGHKFLPFLLGARVPGLVICVPAAFAGLEVCTYLESWFFFHHLSPYWQVFDLFGISLRVRSVRV